MRSARLRMDWLYWRLSTGPSVGRLVWSRKCPCYEDATWMEYIITDVLALVKP